MLKPLSDHVVVKPLEEESKTKAGIVLPDSAKEKPQKGEVVAVGSGKLLENGSRAAMEIKVGDKVLFSKYGPNEVKIDDQTYYILTESDIYAII
ncbi:co-chaperone GroES [Candidatus Falkowbacteria bacterium]|nr:co-chaperone GroES [Candidatus Falkowbacteria bacterium]